MVTKTVQTDTFSVLTDMLIHPFLGLVHGSVGVAAVVLPGRIVAASHVIIPMVALGCDMWIRRIVVNSSIASMSYGVVSIRVLSVYVHVVGLKLVHRVIGSSRHLHLPQRVLGIYAAAVVGVGVAIFQKSHIWP